MKITVLAGSPHRNGTTSVLVKAFTEGAEEAGNEVTCLNLASMNIHPCLGCDHCRQHGGVETCAETPASGEGHCACDVGVRIPGGELRRPQRLTSRFQPLAAYETQDAPLRKGVPCLVASFPASGHGVVSAASPGVAFRQPLYREPQPLQGPVPAQCLEGVLRAGGRKAAGGRRQGRDAELVETYERDQREGADAFTELQQSFPESFGRHGQWFCMAGPPSRSIRAPGRC